MCTLTFDRVKEVEERVIGNLFGNGADGSAAFMLLLLLNSFHCHVLPLVPIDLTAAQSRVGLKDGEGVWRTAFVSK